MKRVLASSITPFEQNPSAFKRMNYTSPQKNRIIEYLKASQPCAACGLIFDCVKGEDVKQENVGYCNDSYMWTSQDVYHIEKYDAAVSEDFLKEVLGVA